MPSRPEHSDAKEATTLLGIVKRVYSRRTKSGRSVSFILMAAMFVVTLLGGQIVYVLDEPRRFALFLALNFTFFLFVILRATLECFDIVREHVRRREQLFRSEIWDADFAVELGRRVRERS